MIAAYAALQATFVAPAVGGTRGTRDTQPPEKPILSLGPATQTSLVLNWQAGSDNVGIDHYNVYRGTSDRPSGQVKVAETNELSYTYTGLTCGTDYSLALVAEDAAGNTSNLAEAIWYPVRTLACSPTTPPAGGTSPTSGGTPPTLGGTSPTSGGTPPTSGGTSPTSGGTPVTQLAPARPDGQPPARPVLSLGPATQTSLVLNWQAGSDNVGIDRLQRLPWHVRRALRPGEDRRDETAQLDTYTGLTCGTDYSLALVAEDAAGNTSILAEAIWYPRSHPRLQHAHARANPHAGRHEPTRQPRPQAPRGPAGVVGGPNLARSDVGWSPRQRWCRGVWRLSQRHAEGNDAGADVRHRAAEVRHGVRSRG